jgi:hypothetical protein
VHWPLVVLASVAPHQKPPLRDRQHPRFGQTRMRARIQTNRFAHPITTP